MKKFLTIIITSLAILALAACGTSEEDNTGAKDNEKDEENQKEELVVGASSTPHSEILEQAKPTLAEKGINLKIETYQDYILPNRDLSEGTLDANFFQHTPYLENQKEEFDYDFASVGPVHIEPMGVYSKNIKSIEDIPEGTDVIMSRSVADHGRILSMFENKGLIKLKEDVDKIEATRDDIAENPKDLQFHADVNAELLPQNYEREEDALVAINTNYAIKAELNPTKDSLFIESAESPYANLVVTKTENKDNEAVQTLVDVLQSEEIVNFIKEEYDGAIVPVEK